jgi:hypothetical protein
VSTPLWQSEVTEWSTDEGVTVYRRDTFCAERFHYKLGEHVVFGGPTTRGKTTLAFDLLQYVASPEHPAYVAVSKPADPVTARRGAELGYRRVTEWPAPKRISEMLGGKKPSGYLIWPPFGDLDRDMERCALITDKLLRERYSSGAKPKNTGGILVMDDTMVKAKIMGLDKQMVTILAMAGAMKIGLWIFVQKPSDSGSTPLWGYENGTHLFFTKGGDHRMLQRYAEICGEYGQIVKAVIPKLKPFQFLYVHKTEGYLCIVDAE